MLYDSDIYPSSKIDLSSISINRVFEITKELEHNPVKIVLKIFGGYAYSAELWAANHILDPYTETYAGRILKIPDLVSVNSSKTSDNQPYQSKNLKTAKISNNTIQL